MGNTKKSNRMNVKLTMQGVGWYRRETCSSTEDAWRCQRYDYKSQTKTCWNEIRAQLNARSSWWRQGLALNSTLKKYACHFQQYARFFLRASYLYVHRPSAGNSKRVRLFRLDAKLQPNHQLRHASFAWLYLWSYNLCRIMWRWQFARLWLGTRQGWGW